MQLAAFAARFVRPGDTALDIGAGCGAVGIMLYAHSQAKITLDSIEIYEGAYACLKENYRINAVRGKAIAGDVRALGETGLGRYSFMVSNPPYRPLGSGEEPAGPDALARFEKALTLPQLVEAARALSGKNARLALIYPAERTAQLARELPRGGFEPKILQFIYTRRGAAARLVLCLAKRGANAGLKVEEPIYYS